MEMERRNPDDIRADVSSQLFWDSSLDSSDINVDVAGNKVILTGSVPSYSDRLEAEEDAYAIPGVTSVDNQLAVSPVISPIPSDDDIRMRVENVLDWNPIIDASRIDISVEDGIVTLKGAVDSYWQKDKAWDLASNVSGVVDVVNELSVEPLEEVSDEDIRDDILNALDRSYVDAGDVNVSVKGCVVTLDGTVHDYNEFRTVEQIADFTAGVCDVKNNLVIASV
ncbi:MAG TPA: BON domain-containing protein [Deltaproteobacteria bacterium]|jgi:osmotically-inducible protein OsmY|nr:BON domain-containing protein [Deltaproteobacteria bacterium]HQI01566.1 BON domain-containing protein [Deltaproteobacteria bacterium]HQJ09719.1 BON domain-containing protein [Deltaproteobacteria bacterium]